MSPRVRSEDGVVLPTRLLVLGVSLVALGGFAFIATAPEQAPAKAAPAATATTPTPTVISRPKPKPMPAIKRNAVYVEVFNNSNIHGLAARVAARAQSVGWNVVGSDNWYGTIDSSTVYYPPQLKRAAGVLARDLGITRLKPAIDPMRFDRLTVILTGPLG